MSIWMNNAKKNLIQSDELSQGYRQFVWHANNYLLLPLLVPASLPALPSAVNPSHPCVRGSPGSEVKICVLFSGVHTPSQSRQPDPALPKCFCLMEPKQWCSSGWCVCVYANVCVPVLVCEMPVHESVQSLCLSLRLASVADGLDWTGLDWSVQSQRTVLLAVTWIHLESCRPRWHWDLVDINTSQSHKPSSESG